MDIEQAEKNELKKKQRLVAALFVLAIVLSMVFAYWMGAFGLGPSKNIFVYYDFAGGIERGSTVRLSGIKVGRVTEIKFVKESPVETDSDGNADAPASASASTHLRMKLEISKEALKQITEDSKFYINLAGIIGERYVEVVPGTGAQVNRGFSFRGVDPPRVDQLLSQGYGIFGDLREFWGDNKADLKEIFQTLNELSKNLSKILGGMSPEQKKQISALIANLSVTSADLKILVTNLKEASVYIAQNGGQPSWDRIERILQKADKIGLPDIRRLMLEDGIKVNFSSRRVEGTEQ